MSEENLLNSLEFWILHSCNPTESYKLPYSVLFLGGGGGGGVLIFSGGGKGVGGGGGCD